MTKTEDFFRSLTARKGVRLMALYYLVIHMGTYMQQSQLAKLIGCHPQSVRAAIDPLKEHEIWKGYIEVEKIGTLVAYRAIEGKPTNLLRDAVQLVRNEYGE